MDKSSHTASTPRWLLSLFDDDPVFAVKVNVAIKFPSRGAIQVQASGYTTRLRQYTSKDWKVSKPIEAITLV